MKTALITGITGQDGSYLAELLLEKGTKSTASCAARVSQTTQRRTYPAQNPFYICRYDGFGIFGKRDAGGTAG